MRKRSRELSVLGRAFLVGSLPFSGIAARLLAGVDLRKRGNGTVSGSGLYEVAGFGPLAVAGSLDVAKGSVGPLLAGRSRPYLGALAAAASISGHNWSPFLSGSGGRGISPAMGATLALAPEGTIVLAAGLGIGRLARQTGLGSFVSVLVLFPVLIRRRAMRGLAVALAVAVPMLGKRVLGNRPPAEGWNLSSVVSRLVFDRDSVPVTDEDACGEDGGPDPSWLEPETR